MVNSKFIVKCDRVGRSQRYQLDPQAYNTGLVKFISELETDQRKYNNDTKLWTLTVRGLYRLISNYRKSDKIKFDFGSQENRIKFIDQIKKIQNKEEEDRKKLEELQKRNIDAVAFKNELKEKFNEYSDLAHRNLKDFVKLYDYQLIGAIFLNRVKSALMSMDMGTGKTIVSIAYVEMNPIKKVFVVTPNSLKYNYFDEVEKFTISSAHILNAKDNKYSIEDSKYIIVNYDFFRNKDSKQIEKKLKKLGIDLSEFECVICDESHKLKNSQSNTYKNFKKFFSHIDRKVFLTGTPTPNRITELYTVLNQISPLEFSNKTFFYDYYCGKEYQRLPYGHDFVKVREPRLKELFNKLEPYSYRVRKVDVLTELPPKTYQKVVFEMDTKDHKKYLEIEEGVAKEILGMKKPNSANALTIMLRLRQFTAELKIDYLKNLISEVIDVDEKFIIVDSFKDTLKILHKYYPDVSGLHTGDQNLEERNEIKRLFQNKESYLKIFLGSIQTCNYGLTLTAASKMFIISLPYSVGEYDQVADRIFRIGQENPVNIYPLIFRDTIDEYVFNSIENKRKEITKAIDNIDYKSDIGESVIGEIIKTFKRKYG